MKNAELIVCAALLVSAAPAAAGGNELPANVNWDLVVKNLVVGIKSDNLGLQRSCALMLGSLKAQDAVIPLMAALHNGTDCRVRSAAAWALCQIDDERGRYAVKQTVIWDGDARTKAICAWYYNLYVKEGTFLIHQQDLTQTASLLP